MCARIWVRPGRRELPLPVSIFDICRHDSSTFLRSSLHVVEFYVRVLCHVHGRSYFYVVGPVVEKLITYRVLIFRSVIFLICPRRLV